MPSNIDTLISSGDENKIRENVINRLISTKKTPILCISVYSILIGGETRSRTQINGFGDRCSTIELFPLNLAISKYLIINFLGPYLQDPYRTFHYNFA